MLNTKPKTVQAIKCNCRLFVYFNQMFILCVALLIRFSYQQKSITATFSATLNSLLPLNTRCNLNFTHQSCVSFWLYVNSTFTERAVRTPRVIEARRRLLTFFGWIAAVWTIAFESGLTSFLLEKYRKTSRILKSLQEATFAMTSFDYHYHNPVFFIPSGEK